MKYCPNCGSEVGEEQENCPVCKAPLPWGNSSAKKSVNALSESEKHDMNQVKAHITSGTEQAPPEQIDASAGPDDHKLRAAVVTKGLRDNHKAKEPNRYPIRSEPLESPPKIPAQTNLELRPVKDSQPPSQEKSFSTKIEEEVSRLQKEETIHPPESVIKYKSPPAVSKPAVSWNTGKGFNIKESYSMYAPGKRDHKRKTGDMAGKLKEKIIVNKRTLLMIPLVFILILVVIFGIMIAQSILSGLGGSGDKVSDPGLSGEMIVSCANDYDVSSDSVIYVYTGDCCGTLTPLIRKVREEGYNFVYVTAEELDIHEEALLKCYLPPGKITVPQLICAATKETRILDKADLEEIREFSDECRRNAYA